MAWTVRTRHAPRVRPITDRGADMPVRRRAGKRRSTDGLDQWFFVFSSGHDFFDELADLGIETDAYHCPSMEDAESAWRRLGDAFLEIPRHPEQGEPWALKEFVPPTKRRAKRRR
ncbi:hypothetical protein ELH49_26245 (plasmid) [Rhizobium ruizarguesonis]|nr:hypothetical protein RLTA1_32190 [Rhizobium leguminosarum bv. trifolii TA1]TBB38809.1 hypothetical protein ELH49_26245 [Rhizobium ruizarguesonis]